MSNTQKISLWMLLLGALIAALYGQFLHNPIVFDDLYFFLLDNDGHSAIEPYAIASPWNLRFIPYATLAWSAQLFGFGLPPFRIENLVLHWLVVAAMALLVLRLYRLVLPATPAGESTGRMAAIVIAVSLFALHPVAVYAVGYLVQRTSVMAALFSVLALIAYLRGTEQHSKLWLWASVALYLLATHCKEHVVMLPAVIVAMTVLVHENWPSRLRQNWLVFLGYAVVGLLTFYQIRYAVGSAYEIYSAEMLEGVPTGNAHFYSVLTQCELFFKYGLLWLLPNPGWMSVDMREPLVESLFSVGGLGLVAYFVYGIVSIKLLIKKGNLGLVGFALLFPWLMFMTEFSTVRVQEIFVLYRSYIWALGGVILLPLLLMRLNAKLTVMVAVLCAATLFIFSMERLASFSHPVLLWDDAEKLVKDRQSLPGVSRIYYNRGTAWLNEGRVDMALLDMQKAVALSPKFSPAYFNLGIAYSRAKQNEPAIQAYSRAIELDQAQKAKINFRYYYGRAASYEAAQKWSQAAADYQVTCALTGKVGCDKVHLP